jgi:hypothetical protein
MKASQKNSMSHQISTRLFVNLSAIPHFGREVKGNPKLPAQAFEHSVELQDLHNRNHLIERK